MRMITGPQELLVFLFRAEFHDPLDTGAVVPGAVEQDHFAGRRKVRDIALEIPLGLLALGRRSQGDDPADAGVQALGNPLDDATLAGGVSPLEDHDDLEALVPDPFLELDQFDL
jgi:hypothetical protein